MRVVEKAQRRRRHIERDLEEYTNKGFQRMASYYRGRRDENRAVLKDLREGQAMKLMSWAEYLEYHESPEALRRGLDAPVCGDCGRKLYESYLRYEPDEVVFCDRDCLVDWLFKQEIVEEV